MLHWGKPLGQWVTQEVAAIGLALENCPSVELQWGPLCVPSSCSITRVWSGGSVRKIPVLPGDAGVGDCPTRMRPCQSPGQHQANMLRRMRGVMGARCWHGGAPGHPCVSPVVICCVLVSRHRATQLVQLREALTLQITIGVGFYPPSLGFPPAGPLEPTCPFHGSDPHGSTLL